MKESSTLPATTLAPRLLSKVLRWVANAVEPFSFEFVPGDSLPSLLDGHRERLGKQPDLFDQLNDSQANEL
jgi:hypothetical protein